MRPVFTPVPPSATCESGYMMMGGVIMVLLVSALLGSFAFVNRTTNSQDNNYNAGLRFAELALTAHSVAQGLRYGPPENLTDYNDFTNIDGALNLPDGFNLAHLNAQIIVSARDQLPLGGFSPAASAFVALHFTGPARAPTARTSFEAGASKGGMARMAVVVNRGATNNGELCRSMTNGARWGPGEFECLTAAEVGQISAALEDGDVIAPAWETFLTLAGDNKLMRYPQPERPELNSMQQNLNMNDGTARDITNAGLIRSNNITVNNAMTVQNTMEVHGATSFNGAATANINLAVQGPALAPVLRVTEGGNSTQFDNGGSGRQRITVAGETNSLSLHATDPTNATLASMRADAIQTSQPNTTIDRQDASQVNPTEVLVQHSGVATGNIIDGNVDVASNVDAPQRMIINTASQLTINNAYAGVMDVGGATNVTTTNTNEWFVGSIEQRGATGRLRVRNVEVRDACRGYACPDRIYQPPDGGL